MGGPRSAETKQVLVNPKAFTKTCFFTAFLQCRWGCLYSKTLFKSICSTPTPTLAQHCLIIQLKMSSMFPPAASSSLPLSVRLLAPRGGSAAMVAAAVWRRWWQIGGSVAGREAAAQRWRQHSFSLAAAVEAQRRQRRWRQCGGGGSSAVAVASASSVATVPAAWCW